MKRRGVKFATSTWLKQNPHFPLFSGWGEGYAAFTYSKDQIPVVKHYIMNQKEHHRRVSARDELIALLQECGVEYDERYV
jgi:hypothetical protein